MAGRSASVFCKAANGYKFLLTRTLYFQTHSMRRRFCKTTYLLKPEEVESSAIANKNLQPIKYDSYRERFIPVTRHTMLSLLLQDESRLTDSEKKDLERFALALDAVISTKFSSSVQELKDLFDPLNPDKDIIKGSKTSGEENEFWLLQRLNQILEKANFYELPISDLKRRLATHEAAEGVKVSVDMKKYDVLKVWMLGKEVENKRVSFFQRLRAYVSLQPSERKMVFKRVITAVKLKKEAKIFLKAFKDVPYSELDKLLPAVQLHMGSFTKYVMGTSFSLVSFGLLAKFITVLANMTVTWPLLLAGASSLLGAQGYLLFKSNKSDYLNSRSRTLYKNNLANNQGLITLVIDRAKDESLKEALLTYAFVLSLSRSLENPSMEQSNTSAVPVSVVTLETAVEEWLLSSTGASVEFDATDSLSLLEQTGILSRSAQGESTCLKVLPLESALRVLPQTPLSIIARLHQSDVMEGYDKLPVKPEELSSDSRSTWFSKLPQLPRFLQSSDRV